MGERTVELDQPVIDEQGQALQNAVERAERAEAELAKLKQQQGTARTRRAVRAWLSRGRWIAGSSRRLRHRMDTRRVSRRRVVWRRCARTA